MSVIDKVENGVILTLSFLLTCAIITYFIKYTADIEIKVTWAILYTAIDMYVIYFIRDM